MAQAKKITKKIKVKKISEINETPPKRKGVKIVKTGKQPEAETFTRPFIKIPQKTNETKKTFRKTVDNQQTNSNKREMNIKSKPINFYRKIAFSFIFLTLILLVVIFYFSFVKLTIILIPNKERISDNLIADIYSKDKQSLASNKAMEGVVEQTEIEETKSYSSSGTEVIGEEIIGQVTIINNYDKNQPLVATTRLLSPDNKLFRIKNTINVPARGSLIVDIYSDELSKEMAIGPTKFTIPGLWAGLQDKIYGESKEKFVYQEQVKKYIKQSDIDQAVIKIKEELIEKARQKFGVSYKGYDKIIYNIIENTISTEIDGKVGEEKEQFKVKMKTSVAVIALPSEKAVNMARNKLSAIIPDNKELIEFNGEEIVYSLNTYNVNQGIATINMSFDGKMSLKENEELVDRHKLVGLTRAQLEEYLNSFKDISGFEIKFSPSFIDKVPNLVDRIKIEIKR
ncbi:MAG: hypothetical protein ABIE43_05125 [Patescibacteria group bacterium]